MKNKTKHLYIHIPFCQKICTYCDFYRKKSSNVLEHKTYLKKIELEILSLDQKFETIYLGGGTPNFLQDDDLNHLLMILKTKLAKKYEFSIECNPEFVTKSQVKIFQKNNINRVSLGVQTFNERILKLLNRGHKNIDVINAINFLKSTKIDNISIDFIYNLPLMKYKDIKDLIVFLKTYQIPHVSCYALEIKKNSVLGKLEYQINVENENNQFEFLSKELQKNKYLRYEISNWCLNSKYQSKHNLAYWNLKDWKAIGVSAYGYENGIYYKNEGNFLKWFPKKEKWTVKELYQNKLIMGLRLIEGIDLNDELNRKAFNFYYSKIDHQKIKIVNEKLFVTNPNLLNDVLIDLID